MSDYAATTNDENYMSAWDYRTLFLSNGTRFEQFHCPFCDIRLCANLIYSEGEISKSPYFSAKWEEHKYDCNGEPIYIQKEEKKSPKAHYNLREISYPEALVVRPPPRRSLQNEPKVTTSKISPADITARRKEAGKLGRPIPKTYLLQPIIEVYNGTWTDGYELAKSKKWDDEKRISWTKEALCNKSLRLEDITNYDDAFRTPAYLSSRAARIYHGSGFVTATQNGFSISSKKEAKINGIHVPFFVVFDNGLVNDSSPKSHLAILSRLREFVGNGAEVRWYAYALPSQADDLCELRVVNPDFVYFKRAFQKRN